MRLGSAFLVRIFFHIKCSFRIFFQRNMQEKNDKCRLFLDKSLQLCYNSFIFFVMHKNALPSYIFKANKIKIIKVLLK